MRARFIAAMIVAALILDPVHSAVMQPSVQRVLVKLRGVPGGHSADWAGLAGRTHLNISRTHPLVAGLHVVQLEPQSPGESLEASLMRLRADAAVEYAEPDQWRHALAVPNDPLFLASSAATGQWYLQNASATASAVDAQDAWNVSTGNAGLVIADIDTGVRFDHPDLLRAGAGGRLLPGYDFVSDMTAGNEASARNADASDPGDWVTQADTLLFDDCTVADSSWHGTRVSGILGALSNNALGIAGITWSGWVLPVRALGKCGGPDSDIEAAMLWAAGVSQEGIPDNPYPARIVNMSLGGTDHCTQASCPQTPCPQSYRTVIDELAQRGVLVVASAGNSGGPVASPANCPGVAAIAGLRQDGTKVGYSNLGAEVSLSAPAGNCVNASAPCLFSIDTTTNLGLTTPAGNSYTNATNTNLGTSFSAPLVSGIAGLMLSVNGNLTPPQLIARLQEGASSPFPVASAAGIPQCHVPDSSADFSQTGECSCTLSTCGAGMANANGAVNAALRPIAAVSLPAAGVSAGQDFVLDAGGSAAACGATINDYSWSILSGSGTLVSAAHGSSLTLLAPAAGAPGFSVQLQVTDNEGRSDLADVSVSAAAVNTSAPASASNNGTTACLAAIAPPAPTFVAVFPSATSLQAGLGSQLFSAAVSGPANTTVTWMVNGVSGGNSATGTISASGFYKAPLNAPAPATLTITAVSAADESISGFAGVTITPPVTVSISPVSASVLAGNGTQGFVAKVSNSSNTAVGWRVNGIAGGNATLGTVSSAGLYTAPATAPSPAAVSVSAVSLADPARSAAAPVTVMADPAKSGANSVAVTAAAPPASHGGGSLDPWTLLALLSALAARSRSAGQGCGRDRGP